MVQEKDEKLVEKIVKPPGRYFSLKGRRLPIGEHRQVVLKEFKDLL